MVEQVDRDAAESFYEGPCTRGLLETILSSHRIAAEARGMEAAARIALEWRNGQSDERCWIAQEIADAIRASIGQEHSSEVERLREALQDVRDCALVVSSIFPDSPPSVSWIVNQLTKVLPKIDAALNGGQHE